MSRFLDFLQRRKDPLTLIAQSLAGAALIGSLVFTWMELQATGERLRITQEATSKNLEIAQQGQVTERFTRAIDQLGNGDSLEIRVGGIYALERIARDSERDHQPVIEVLAAFVRESVPRAEDPSVEGAAEITADIQAALKVLGRTVQPFDERRDQRVDLRDTDLRNASLFRMNLEGAFLRGANLAGVDLRQVCLRKADLTDANLQGADLRGANLDGAALVGANLDEADLRAINTLDTWEEDGCSRVPLEEAGMVEVHGLTADQLRSTASFEGALLPDSLKSTGP